MDNVSEESKITGSVYVNKVLPVTKKMCRNPRALSGSG